MPSSRLQRGAREFSSPRWVCVHSLADFTLVKLPVFFLHLHLHLHLHLQLHLLRPRLVIPSRDADVQRTVFVGERLVVFCPDVSCFFQAQMQSHPLLLQRKKWDTPALPARNRHGVAFSSFL